MKNKGILSFFLVMFFALSSFSTPAFSAEEESKGLEQAILAAKNIVTIPENYTEFNHSSSEIETPNGKIRAWRLEWSEKEGKDGDIYLSIGEDGFLYSYNKYDGERNTTGLAQVKKEEAQVSAEDFLKKVTPKYSEQMKKVDNNSDLYSNEEYYFNYQMYVNEIPVNFIKISIGVNKYTGEVTSFYGKNPQFNGNDYMNTEGIIDQKTAEKAYIDNVGVDLKYYSYYDYKEKKMNVFAAYSAHEGKGIEAKTGQVIQAYEDNDIYNIKDGLKSGSTAAVMDNKSQELTKEEQDAVNDLSNLITKEKAESILRNSFDVITSDMKVKNETLSKINMDNKYVWNISFDGVYGEVDAKSGEVVALHSYKEHKDNSSNISKVQGQDIAEAFLNQNASSKFQQTKYKDVEEKVKKVKVTEEEKVFSFNYVRQVNGVEFSNNLLRVEVDKSNGKIVGYRNEWYDNVSFPDISKAMSKEETFNKIKQIKNFELQYTKLDKNKIALVYDYKELNGECIIDPVSGVRLDFSGKVYRENKLPEYTDINGHWNEKIIKELLDNGYYIEGDKFNPDMSITQINFFKYLYSREKSNYNTDDEFYNMLIQNKVIKEDEKAPNSLVTNKEAAKFITRNLGYDRLAQNSEIFINPFKDSIDEKYKAYAAICYSLNIIKGINGNFNENNNISNAEAATIIYNFINSSDKK